MKSLAQARLKRARAVELVAAGKSYDEVAQVVGYRHRGSAHRAVTRALEDREAAGVDELRALELARLDALQAALWDQAMAGDPRAATVILRVIDQRSRLFGLTKQGVATLSEDAPRYLVRPPEGNAREATEPTSTKVG